MKASDLKKRLTDQQAKAAYLLVLNDFEGGNQTQEEIAQEVGVSRRTLLEWRRKSDFIAYQGALSDQHLQAFRSRADKVLMDQVDKGFIKALDLYYTLLGRKITKTETTEVRQTSTYMSDDDIQAELEKLSKSIEG
ncbi:phBC6A51 family helix-turn-helix protein [Gottfriedia sp. NPDC057948]|uniref:phBC6A51 family helix-turn-helix protein n=1 Tax=Gottfriedia sp. NPDC057948 TaxID=3346287 RepID=UPI0036DC0D27